MQVFLAYGDVIAEAQTLWTSERNLLLQGAGLHFQYEVKTVYSNANLYRC